MNYCSQCGATVTQRIPDGDNRDRYVCDACDVVHYQNPNIVVGTIPVYQSVSRREPAKVLLCKRSIEPRFGYWTLPAGFLENGETTLEGALRETVEESCASLENAELFRVLNVVQNNQVHMFFRAVLPNPEFSATPESSEVALFAFDDIPWRQLAFPTVHRALADYIEAHRRGRGFEASMVDIVRDDWQLLDH